MTRRDTASFEQINSSFVGDLLFDKVAYSLAISNSGALPNPLQYSPENQKESPANLKPNT